MKMYLGQEDLNILFSDVVKRSARELKLSNVDLKSASELFTEISIVNLDIFKKMQQFFEKYQTWYDIHVEIATSDNQGNLNSVQNSELMQAIENRDKYRQLLLDSLDEL